MTHRATLSYVFRWESQARQYLDNEDVQQMPDYEGGGIPSPGISYHAGDVSDTDPGKPPIDCLLMWKNVNDELDDLPLPELQDRAREEGEPDVENLDRAALVRVCWEEEYEWELVGILNHYPVDYPPNETAGTVNVWVHPDHQRKGYGTELFLEAVRRWNVDLSKQRYTKAGAALADRVEHVMSTYGVVNRDTDEEIYITDSASDAAEQCAMLNAEEDGDYDVWTWRGRES